MTPSSLPENASHECARRGDLFISTDPGLMDLHAFEAGARSRDAHGLYAQYGFTLMAAPERFMERHDPLVYQR